MTAVIKRVVSNKLFIQPMAGFIKQQVHRTIDVCRLTQRYAETRKVDRLGVSLLSSRSSSDATKKFESTLNCESSKNQRSRKNKS